MEDSVYATSAESQRLQPNSGPRVSFNRDVHVKRIGNRPHENIKYPTKTANIQSSVPTIRKHLSEKDILREAALVLAETEKAAPVSSGGTNIDTKFHSLPNRKKKKTNKPVTRSVSDASTKKPVTKKPSIFNLFSKKSDTSLNKIERDPRFEDGGARRLIRSKSDVTSYKNAKEKVSKKNSEAPGPIQLSPIIENSQKEDYFEKEDRRNSDVDGVSGYLHHKDLDFVSKPIADKISAINSKSLENMHSSQLPPEKPPLTKGIMVDNMVKRLSMERFSPPPSILGPTFSYTRPNQYSPTNAEDNFYKKMEKSQSPTAAEYINVHKQPYSEDLVDSGKNSPRGGRSYQYVRKSHSGSPRTNHTETFTKKSHHNIATKEESHPFKRSVIVTHSRSPYNESRGVRVSRSPARVEVLTTTERFPQKNVATKSSRSPFSNRKEVVVDRPYRTNGGRISPAGGDRYKTNEGRGSPTAGDNFSNSYRSDKSPSRMENSYTVHKVDLGRHSSSPWRQLSPRNFSEEDDEGLGHETYPRPVPKERNNHSNGRTIDRSNVSPIRQGNYNSLSHRRHQLETRISSRKFSGVDDTDNNNDSLDRSVGTHKNGYLFHKPRNEEIMNRYSPDRTHLDMINGRNDHRFGSPNSASDEYIEMRRPIKEEVDDIPNKPWYTNTSSLKRNKQQQRSFDKGDSGIENDFRKETPLIYIKSLRDNVKACEQFIRKEKRHTEEIHPRRKRYNLAYRERSIDDGSLYDPRLDKYPVSKTIKESSPTSPKTKGILKSSGFGAKVKNLFHSHDVPHHHTSPSRKNITVEKTLSHQKAYATEPRIIDIATRRRLSTPKASPQLKRTSSEKQVMRNSTSPKNSGISDHSTKPSWIKSLDRRTNSKSTSKEKLHPFNDNLASSKSEKKDIWNSSKQLRFFGESDLDSVACPKPHSSTLPRPPRPLKNNYHNNISKSSQTLNKVGRVDSGKRIKSSSMYNLNKTNGDEVDAGKRRHFHHSRSHTLRDISESGSEGENIQKRRTKSLSRERLEDEEGTPQRRQRALWGPPKPPRLAQGRYPSRGRFPDSSGTEEESSLHSQHSVVYLHATTIGDIPQPYKFSPSVISARNDEFKKKPKNQQHTEPMTRSVNKSFAVKAPWTPKLISDGYEINYSQDQDQGMRKVSTIPRKYTTAR